MERRYELVRRLAAGGMGEVFVARLGGAGDFEKRVALKLLLPHLAGSADLVARFHAEARLAARMHHPNIVEIFDVGEADGRPFLAMQLVEGVSLARAIRRLTQLGQQLPLPLVRLVAVGLCEALTYAHTLTDERGASLQVVHRDVTPSNILLSTAGAVLLTDFGIARAGEQGALVEPGVVRGKVAYLAPEQVLHTAPVDARADLYAAALTLFELACGENPLKGATPEETLDRVRRGALPLLSTRRPDATPGLTAALARALRADPAQRFPSVRAFREAFVDGPVATGPELAAWVQGQFGAELVVRGEEPAPTGTLVTVTPGALPPVRAQRRWTGVALLAALLGLGAVAALVAVVAVDRGAGAEGLGRVPGEVSAVPGGAGEGSEAPGGNGTSDAPPGGPAGDGRSTAEAAGSGPAGDEPAASPASGASPRLVGDVTRAVAPPAPPGSQGEASVAPAPGVAQPSSKGSRRTVTGATSRRRAPLRVGFLTADAVPWAEVEEAGIRLDRTPFARFPLPAGRHTLVFRGPDGKRAVRTVLITQDQVSLVRVEFR